MLRARMTRLRHLFMLFAIILGTNGPAFAQDDEKKGPFREPGIEYRKESSAKPYIDWLFGALLIAGSAFLLFKNPHRTHLD